MSKASEWTERLGERPRFFNGAARAKAWVTDQGDLGVENGGGDRLFLTPDDAAQLGAWILDTFGERNATEGSAGS